MQYIVDLKDGRNREENKLFKHCNAIVVSSCDFPYYK